MTVLGFPIHPHFVGETRWQKPMSYDLFRSPEHASGCLDGWRSVWSVTGMENSGHTHGNVDPKQRSMLTLLNNRIFGALNFTGGHTSFKGLLHSAGGQSVAQEMARRGQQPPRSGWLSATSAHVLTKCHVLLCIPVPPTWGPLWPDLLSGCSKHTVFQKVQTWQTSAPSWWLLFRALGKQDGVPL